MGEVTELQKYMIQPMQKIMGSSFLPSSSMHRGAWQTIPASQAGDGELEQKGGEHPNNPR